MTTFDLEMETLPFCSNAREMMRASDALAQTAANLLEEGVPGGTAEYAARADVPDLDDSQDQDTSGHGMATGANDMPQPLGIEAAATCSEFPATQPLEPEAGDAASAALQARRNGARGHYMGETVGSYVGHNFGARRIKPHSNHHDLNGVHFQIRTMNGSQGTFTGAKTDPDKIIVAAKKRDGGLQGGSRYALHGVLRADAFAVAKKSRSRGHVNSGHYLVSLSQVQKVELGSMIIPDELVVADTSEQRTERLDRISTLEPDLDDPSIRAARAFLVASSSHTEPEAPDDAPTATEATSGVSPNAPGEAI